jgi:hypothetical protein
MFAVVPVHMNEPTPVAIVGAGPYGLSIAAHLRAKGIRFRIFGSPMYNWKHGMPAGMHLKSDGFACNLYDPDSAFTLEDYCRRTGEPYADRGLPVALETFVAYGLEFQRRFVPDLEECHVLAIEPLARGFRLRLANGGIFTAGRVVVAIGISYFQHIPAELEGLPEEFVSHSSRLSTLGHLKGRDTTVLGAGASAVDIAYLLHRAGATVRIVARGPKIRFVGEQKAPLPGWLEQLRRPRSGLGPGWRSRLCTDAPLLFRLMPQRFRLMIVRRHLGPAPGWFVKEKDLEDVPVLMDTRVAHAEVREGRVHIRLLRGGGELDVVTDHVVAATGYRSDLRRLPFLGDRLRASIRSVEHTPVLSANFESSVRGLYFVGLASANTFGPMLRFAYGAGFTARRLSRHLRRMDCASQKSPHPGFAKHSAEVVG